MVIDLRELFKLTEQIDINDKVMQELLTAIHNNQQKDFDYLRFKLSYRNLMDLGMDENTAAKSAMLTAETMGVTKDKLMMTIQHYQNVLTKEREKFVVALRKQITNNVDSKLEDIRKYREKIEANKIKIQQLTDEQELIEKEINNIENALSSSKEKIEEIKNQFNTTFEVLFKQIEDDSTHFDNIL